MAMGWSHPSAVRGVDDHDLRTIGLFEPSRDGLGDAVRGEVLALKIKKPLRRRDLLEKESLDLVDRLLVVHLRMGTGDGDVDVLERRPEPSRPAFDLRLDRLELLARGTLPSIATGPGEGGGGRSTDRGRGVMPWIVGRSVEIDARGIHVVVGRRVPARTRHVYPAAEGQAVVDRHDLLVMRGACRVMAVEL